MVSLVILMRPGQAQMQENPDETVRLIVALIIEQIKETFHCYPPRPGHGPRSIGGGGHHF